ncbi:MAG: TldD/PmbA family protein [Candidatus Micrarchaeota archaeon]
MALDSKIPFLGRKYGCAIELYFEGESTTTLSAEREKIHSKDQVSQEGFAVRTIKDGRMGFYSFELKSELEKAISTSLKLGKLQEKADYFFPGTRGVSKKHFDAKALNFGENAMPKLQAMVDLQLGMKVTPVQNIVGASITKKSIINTEGGSTEGKSSNFFAISQCGYKETEADDSINCAKFNFEPMAAAANAAKFAKDSAGAKKTGGGKRSVVFDIRAFQQLLYLFMPFNFSGESLRKKLTKIGRGEVFSKTPISIVDDPGMALGSRPREFDDEGFISKKRAIVKSGIVSDFLFDMQTCAKMKNETPGNGSRASYQSQPSIGATNISIDGGNYGDLIGEIGKGIYLNSFLTSGANHVTGDFSFPLMNANLIEKGEITTAIKGAMMKGNFFELMNDAHFERKTEIYNGLKAGRMACELEIIC